MKITIKIYILYHSLNIASGNDIVKSTILDESVFAGKTTKHRPIQYIYIICSLYARSDTPTPQYTGIDLYCK